MDRIVMYTIVFSAMECGFHRVYGPFSVSFIRDNQLSNGAMESVKFSLEYWTVRSLFLEVYSPRSNASNECTERCVYVDTKVLRNTVSKKSCLATRARTRTRGLAER